MSNKGLLDVIEEMLDEGVNDHINKITMDNIKDGKSFNPDGPSADTQGVLGTTSGAALDAGGDKDVAPSGRKGEYASGASADTQGVEGTTSGSALDAGGDVDVGHEKSGTIYKKGHPSDASAEVEADKGPHDQANDPGLKEFYDAESDTYYSIEDLEAMVEEGFEIEMIDDEEIDEAKLTKKQIKHALSSQGSDRNKTVSLAGPNGTKITAVKKKPSDGGGYKVDEDHYKVGDFVMTESELLEFMEEYEIEAVDWVEDEFEIEESLGSGSDRTKGRMSDDEKDMVAKFLKDKGAKKLKTGKADGTKYGYTQGAVKGGKARGAVGSVSGGKRIDQVYNKVNKRTPDSKFNKEEIEFEDLEDETLEEAEGEKLHKVSGEANREMRPDEEKGDNLPKDKTASHGSEHKPHVQANDPYDTATKANPKGAVSEEAEDELEEKKADKDYDGDGEIESGTDEYMGSRDKAIKKAMAKEDTDEEVEIEEDFKARAEVIFEAAVGEKVAKLKEAMEEENAKVLAEEKAMLNEMAAEYIEEAVSEWLKENALEIRYSLRTEIAENFITGLKGLFEESYIEIPEEDYSAVDELTEAVEEQKEQIDSLMEELKEAKAFILESKRKSIVAELSEDLTQTQAVRLEKLSEGLEASDIEEFKEKVTQLKEGYFDPSNETPLLELSEEVFTGTEALMEDHHNTSVSQYAKFLSKTVLK